MKIPEYLYLRFELECKIALLIALDFIFVRKNILEINKIRLHCKNMFCKYMDATFLNL